MERKSSLKKRLGTLSEDSNSNSNDSYQNQPRYILDLNINVDSCNDHIAKEIAEKLCEKKDDLLRKFFNLILFSTFFNFLFVSVRIVSILGREIPIKLFKETQKIESDGGMLIMVRIKICGFSK